MTDRIELVKRSDVKKGVMDLENQFKPFNFRTLDFTKKKK